MKKINSNQLLESLQADVRQIILQAASLQLKDIALLELPPAPGKWSAAQVLEHLNIYSRYYIPAIEKKLHLHQTKPAVYFTPGWLGNYFTKLMLPSAGDMISKKIKAPKNAIPAASPNAAAMLEEFILHQHHLINLLQIARTADIARIKIPISISKFIHLKMGDTFRFFIAHEQRHFVQVSNIFKINYF
jgi:hypothetical protein